MDTTKHVLTNMIIHSLHPTEQFLKSGHTVHM